MAPFAEAKTLSLSCPQLSSSVLESAESIVRVDKPLRSCVEIRLFVKWGRERCGTIEDNCSTLYSRSAVPS